MAPLLRILNTLRVPFDFTYPGHVHDLGAAFWNNVLKILPVEQKEYAVAISGPSPVETTINAHPLRTVLAYAAKLPAYVLREGYPFAGGWEVFIQRRS